MEELLQFWAVRFGISGMFLVGVVYLFKFLQKSQEKRITEKQEATDRQIIALEKRAEHCEEEHAKVHGEMMGLATDVIRENTKALQYSADCLHEVKSAVKVGCGKEGCGLVKQ